MIDAGAIKRRQDAVWAAVDGGSDVADAVDAVTRSMRKGPDLERAVGRARGAKNASIGAVLPPHLARPRCQRRIAALRAARDAAHAAWTLASDFKSKCGDEEKVPSLLRGFIDAGDYSQSALETLEVIERETKFPSVSSSDKKAFKGPSLVASLDPGGDGDDASEAIRQDDEACTKLLERFLDHSGTWTAAAAACATLDAVSALANFARDGGINNPMCRPSFVTRAEGEDATFEAKELWHPCAVTASSSGGSGRGCCTERRGAGERGKRPARSAGYAFNWSKHGRQVDAAARDVRRRGPGADGRAGPRAQLCVESRRTPCSPGWAAPATGSTPASPPSWSNAPRRL
jgi:hypothetical protein